MKILNNHIEVPVGKISPDPNQPRKYFDEKKIKTIAASINSNIGKGKTGIINPIEVDENYQIITGECRWRAAVLAGLPTVTEKVLELSPDERYWRQGVENINRKNMTSVEEADWYWDVLV